MLFFNFIQIFFQQYTCTSQNEKFEYGYPHFNALLQFDIKLERCKPHKVARDPMKGDVIEDASISQDILSQSFDVIQSDVALQTQAH